MRNLILAVFVLFSAVASRSALACSCMPLGTVKEDFAKTELVFLGEVKTRKPVAEKDGAIYQYIYTVKVEKAYKGKLANEVTITSGSDSAMCGFNMTVGEKYLLWIDSFGKTKNGVRELDVNNCSRSRIVSHAKDDIDWLEKNAH